MRATVVGAGIAGLTTALLLARDGHEVIVLERDPAPPPESSDAEAAWSGWERTGVNQFRLLHFFVPRFRAILEAELPDVASALAAAGAVRYNQVSETDESVTGGWVEGDEVFDALTARRPVVEAAIARIAATTGGLDVRRGVTVAGLVAATSESAKMNGQARPPHVIGVRLEDGDLVASDLVVDASGRRSLLPRWLRQLGSQAHEAEQEEGGFTYYARHLRFGGGSLPRLEAPMLSAHGSVSVLTVPADNGTAAVGIVVASGDTSLQGLRDGDTWLRVLRSFPRSAAWAEGDPLEEVKVMAKIEDRHRRYVVDGEPIASGVVAIGDSWACTNPSLGRGGAMALLHATVLRDQLHLVGDVEPRELALRFDEATMAAVEPHYRSTLQYDRHRLAEMQAAIRGETYEPDDPAWDVIQAVQHAATSDGTALRGFHQIAGLLKTTDEVMAQPGFLDRVIELGSGWRDAPPTGPDRAELLDLVGA